MTYPQLIQSLIVEDDPSMVEVYRAMFDDFRREGFFVDQPHIVESYDDAIDAIRAERPYHLAIIDLRLPERVGGDSEELSARGLQLIPELIGRSLYPVGVVLVLTGDPRRIVNHPALRRQLNSFWWSDVATKGLDIDSDVRTAIEEATKFYALGIHVIDLMDDVKPHLTPAEEYLLRRAVMKTSNAIGVDLRWWSAARRDFGAAEAPGWVKVLYGRIIFDEEHGASRLRFFKLGSRQNGITSHEATRAIGERLQHVRVVDFEVDELRSLLITDKVGASDERPLTLTEALRNDPKGERAETIANDIAEQLRALGEKNETQIPLSQLLWPHHDEDRIATVWQTFCGDSTRERPSPTAVLRAFRAALNAAVVAVRLIHGDLHVENVAIDRDGDQFRAFIFDPAAIKRNVCVRDFAMLEVSLLLHIHRLPELDIIDAAAPLFDGREPGGDGVPTLSGLRADVRLLSEIRRCAITECSSSVYALLLLDAVLMQLGGLAFGITSNKVGRPNDVVRLFDLLLTWIGREDFPEEHRLQLEV